MNPNKKLHLSVGEQEWVDALMEVYGATKIGAYNIVIRYKREQAFMWRQRGNDALADQLLDEIGELDVHRDETVPTSKKHFKRIVLPGEDNPVKEEEKKIIIVK